MTPDLERFVDLATRPLEGKPEQREEAKVELMARIGHQGMPLEMVELDDEVACLEKAPVPKIWPCRVTMLLVFVGLLVATVVMTSISVREGALSIQAQMMGYRYGFGSTSRPEESMLSQWIETRAPGIPLRNGSEMELSEAVSRNSGDVALLQQELLRAAGESPGGLSSEQRGKANTIDRGNGYYDFIDIQSHLAKAMGGSGRMRSTSAKVADEKAFEAALKALSDAASAERFHDASGELKRRQLDAFPSSQGIMEELIQVAFSNIIRSSAPKHRYYYSSSGNSVISIQAERMEKNSDVKGLLDSRDQVLALGRLLVSDSDMGGVDVQGALSWITENLNPIRSALHKLGEKAEGDELDELVKELEEAGLAVQGGSWLEESPSLRLSEWDEVPADLTVAEILPAGRAERAFFLRLLALAGSILALLLGSFTAFEAYRRPRRVAGMAKGLRPLLDWKDHAWIVGLGVVLPWAWFLVVVCLTPLGLRDLSMGYRDGLGIGVSLIQASGAFIFAAVMILWTAYWRWEIRGGFLAFRGGAMVIGRISGYLAAASVPAAGLIRYFDLTSDEEMAFFLLGVSGLATTGLLWLIWIAVLNLCTPKSNALRANVVMRAALPVMFVGLASTLVAAWIQWSAEKHWVDEDRLFHSSTSTTHLNALEERISKDLRERVMAVLDEAP